MSFSTSLQLVLAMGANQVHHAWVLLLGSLVLLGAKWRGCRQIVRTSAEP